MILAMGRWFHRDDDVVGDDYEGDDDEDDDDDGGDGEDDESDFEDRPGSSRLLNRWASNTQPAAQGNVVPIRPKLTVPVPVPSPWRWQVDSVAKKAPLPRPEAPAGEISWVLDPIRSGANVTIEMASRALKKNGELGKPMPMRVPHMAVPLMAPAEREIFSLLGASSYTSYGTFDRVLNLGWPASEYVLPKIVATGRLFIRVGKGEYELCTAFDDGEPWQLAVHAEEREGKYVLVPELRRGDEWRPLQDAVCVTHGGFVVFDNSIARFADDHGTYRWAQMLLREDVEVPQKELDQFVKAVGASSTALRIEWPGDVRWQEQREPLRATL
jgi:hypothetical protein